jgi:hypothetical protein
MIKDTEIIIISDGKLAVFQEDLIIIYLQKNNLLNK